MHNDCLLSAPKLKDLEFAMRHLAQSDKVLELNYAVQSQHLNSSDDLISKHCAVMLKAEKRHMDRTQSTLCPNGSDHSQ